MEYQLYLKADLKAREAKLNREAGANRWVCKIILLVIFFTLSATDIKAQSVPEIGVSGGTSQYMGDLNNSNFLYMPSFAGGIIFLHNLNPRMGFKINISYAQIKGSGHILYDDNVYRDFTNSFLNYGLSYFVNFLEYDFGLNNYNYTPYFSIGIGYNNILNNPEAEKNVSIPFGPGIRFLIKNKMSVGVEYIINRSFTDALDGTGITNYGDDLNEQDELTDDIKNSATSSFLINKDWYSHLSLVITFKFINFANDCPAYDE